MAHTRRRAGNLPAELTSFVGRRGEVAEVRRMLAESRLVTLTGMGGVGKTRLALRAAAGQARAFADGAWLVQLDQLRDEALAAQAVAGRLLWARLSVFAAELVISQQTAEGHVERILTKLGFTSRAQVAAWVAASPPDDDRR